ncbi:MAG TPA: site-2 protease family protein [Kofleriaceae bacterium]
MNVDAQDIRNIIIYVFVLIVSVALHEFGHAIMATWLGDDTPRRQGRVTLNPIAHADPIGTLLLPIVGGLYAAASHGLGGGFGWGKPVQWQPARINRKWHMATAQILVAVAGPAMNVLLGTVIALVNVILLAKHVLAPQSQLNSILFFACVTNFVLFFFNLIPAPPLDGGHVAEGLTPYKHRAHYEAYAKYGPFVVMAVAFIPQLARIFLIPAQFCAEHVYNAFGHLLM